jgi:hypothetical protein
VKRERVCGNPDTDTASTSYAERLNLGLRMAKPHQALGGRTPAMAAGVADRRFTAADLAAL